MNEFDRAQAAVRKRRGCSFCAAVDRLTPSRRTSLDRALSESRYDAQAIVTVLNQWGVDVSRHMVGRHRPFNQQRCAYKFPEGQ